VQPLLEEVKRFLEANIESVDQLEILRLLGEDPHKEWQAEELAREAQTTPAAIAMHLAALHTRGLLGTRTQEIHLFCRYGPATPELAEKVERLLQVYRERPVTMIKLVYARSKDMLKTFAEAFRLKRED
jgi:DNA-binding MarR family transcriptional regulator